MRRKSTKEFKIKFIPPYNISAYRGWILQKSYWTHIERVLNAEKVVEDNNEAAKSYTERRTLGLAQKRKKDNEKRTKENNYYFGRVKQSAAYYRREEQDLEWKRKHGYMKHMCKYSITWTIKKEEDVLFTSGPQSRATILALEPIPKPIVDFKLRPRCFFDLRIENDIYLGRIVFELYGEYVPKTAANFLSLCKGYDGLTYKGSFFHRILPGLMCQGGDITEFNGSGGMTIFGDVFNKENFKLKHGGIGVLSMSSISPTQNTSQFNITFRDLHILDGKSVVVGKIVNGINTLLKVEEFGYGTGKPRMKVVIIDCGQI